MLLERGLAPEGGGDKALAPHLRFDAAHKVEVQFGGSHGAVGFDALSQIGASRKKVQPVKGRGHTLVGGLPRCGSLVLALQGELALALLALDIAQTSFESCDALVKFARQVLSFGRKAWA